MTIARRAHELPSIPADVADDLTSAKASVCRRFRMRLPATMNDARIAELASAAREHVARWRQPDNASAPTLRHLLSMPDAVLDVLMQCVAEAREKRGHARRQWAAVDDARSQSKRDAAVARLRALADEIEKL